MGKIIFLLALASGSAQALQFSTVMRCEGDKGPWCLKRTFEKGRSVAFLTHPDCHGTVGETRSVASDIESFETSTLENVNCPAAEYGDEVVFDVKVKSYRKFEIKPVGKQDHPKGLDKALRKRADFKKLTLRSPGQDELPPANWELRLKEILLPGNSGKTFIATYTEEGEIPFLVSPTGMKPLVDLGGSVIVGEPKAFELNGRKYLSLDECQMGTDNCTSKFVELGK